MKISEKRAISAFVENGCLSEIDITDFAEKIAK